MSHTPGPWTCATKHGFPWHVNGDTETVCRIGGHETAVIDEDECEANASLIAAAPDLLEAIEAIINANDSPPGATMGEAKVCEYYAKRAREAIAKARGGSVL